MAYQSLYRKYRSRDFGDLMGQRHVTQTLANAIGSARVAHAYLFCGPRGTGKTSTARVLAKALNCVNGPTATPCDVCPNCIAIRQGSALDVVEIDAASNRNIDDIRQLREQVNYPPVELRYKFYIVDEVHQLTRDSFNAFLKTLEEPPPHVIFVLCTTDSHQLPATILSRCQRFDFHRITINDIVERLAWVAEQEGWAVEAEAIHLLARAANGGLRDALSLLDQASSYAGTSITAGHVRDILGGIDFTLLHEYVDLLLTRDANGLFHIIDRILAEGKDVPQLVAELIQYWRNLLRVAIGGPDVLPELSPEQRQELQRQAKATQQTAIMRAITLLCEAENELRWNGQQRLLLELYSVRIMSEDSPVAVAPPAATPVPARATAEPRPAPRPTPQPAAAAPASAPSAATAASGAVAAPTTPPASTPEPTGDSASWTLPRLKQSWPAFLEWMTQTPNRKKMRDRVVEKCWPSSLSGDTVTLATTSGFVRSLVTDTSRPEIKQVLVQCLRDFFKVPFDVQMELLEAPAAAAVATPTPAPPPVTAAPAAQSVVEAPPAEAPAAPPAADENRDVVGERMRQVFRGSYEVKD